MSKKKKTAEEMADHIARIILELGQNPDFADDPHIRQITVWWLEGKGVGADDLRKLK
jgi:hypothetical protein